MVFPAELRGNGDATLCRSTQILRTIDVLKTGGEHDADLAADLARLGHGQAFAVGRVATWRRH